MGNHASRCLISCHEIAIATQLRQPLRSAMNVLISPTSAARREYDGTCQPTVFFNHVPIIAGLVLRSGGSGVFEQRRR